MTGGSKMKNYSHIWDNVITGSGPKSNFTRRQQNYEEPPTILTSSSASLSIVEYSKTEILFDSCGNRIQKCQKTSVPPPQKPQKLQNYPDYPPKVVRIVKNPQKCAKTAVVSQSYCTNRDRQLAEAPAPHNVWKFQKERKQEYDSAPISSAFEEYSNRLQAKKMEMAAERKRTAKMAEKPKNHVIVSKKEVQSCKMGRKLGMMMSRKRDDEVRIDAIQAAEDVETSEVVEVVGMKTSLNSEDVDGGDDHVIQPGFYGTVEAEKAIEKTANYMSQATENMQRLHFITSEVYPECQQHLKTVREIECDLKEFGQQMRTHSIKPPLSIACSQVAHFVVAAESFTVEED